MGAAGRSAGPTAEPGARVVPGPAVVTRPALGDRPGTSARCRPGHRSAGAPVRRGCGAGLRIRAFSAGNAAIPLSSIARGGLEFMLIIWLQGIRLPLHGYDYVDTPLWAGIYLLPLTVGFCFSTGSVPACSPRRTPRR
nr:hypothetical protein [Frankia sp. AgB32]